MINSDYLNNLNKAQKEAVLHLDGPLLIVAGAGSGKTKVLTSRIAHIIKEKKAFPNQILSVTFTNKAAKEMQFRVRASVSSSSSSLIRSILSLLILSVLNEGLFLTSKALSGIDLRSNNIDNPYVSKDLSILNLSRPM